MNTCGAVVRLKKEDFKLKDEVLENVPQVPIGFRMNRNLHVCILNLVPLGRTRRSTRTPTPEGRRRGGPRKRQVRDTNPRAQDQEEITLLL